MNLDKLRHLFNPAALAQAFFGLIGLGNESRFAAFQPVRSQVLHRAPAEDPHTQPQARHKTRLIS